MGGINESYSTWQARILVGIQYVSPDGHVGKWSDHDFEYPLSSELWKPRTVIELNSLENGMDAVMLQEDDVRQMSRSDIIIDMASVASSSGIRLSGDRPSDVTKK